MSVRWDANQIRKQDWIGTDLNIDENVHGLCSGRMIYALGGVDFNYNYLTLEDFIHDLKILRKYANDSGAKFYYCFTNEEQDRERSYLDALGFDTKEIPGTDLYFSTITKADFAKNFTASKRRRFK